MSYSVGRILIGEEHFRTENSGRDVSWVRAQKNIAAGRYREFEE
jgi:hypothetical protein